MPMLNKDTKMKVIIMMCSNDNVKVWHGVVSHFNARHKCKHRVLRTLLLVINAVKMHL